MNNDLTYAREQLRVGAYTCVLCKGNTVYTSRERGVAPLLSWLTDGVDVTGFSAADKVVGKATAFLYVLAGVQAVYAPVMSAPALETLTRWGIQAVSDTVIPAVRNRAGTGLCPMEQAVQDIDAPEAALAAIQNKWRTLHSQS